MAARTGAQAQQDHLSWEKAPGSIRFPQRSYGGTAVWQWGDGPPADARKLSRSSVRAGRLYLARPALLLVWERTLGRAHIIGIHGLANKPPRDEKAAWWHAAIREGLDRNLGLRVAEADLPFTFVYWADLRYPQPLSGDRNREPYGPDYGLGP